MNHSKAALVIVFCTVALVGCGQSSDRTASRQDNTSVYERDRNTADANTQQQYGSAAMRTDNTRMNERDRNSSESTADQQHENSTDRELTQKIRQSVMADNSFSTYAKNIKIISEDGKVTLKGPVSSAQEKRSIVAMAVSATGDAAKVTDQITIEN